jgi:hypothetical protein
MRLQTPGGHHLTYCTNIHPGESWTEVRDNLVRYVLPVRERVARGRPFGLGLRLSDRAARTLIQEQELSEFRVLLHEHDLYLFTINGFPYGTFHGQPVKEGVYLPDWLEPERLDYTNRLADILAAVLPEGVEGTISTVPGAFAPRVGGGADAVRMATAMAMHVAHLVRIRRAEGRHLSLAIEPEPCCYLETVSQTVNFFSRYLFGTEAVTTLAREVGLSPAAAEEALRQHLGVCFDTCHMAVEFEDPAAALATFERAGVRIAKVQVSAGLRVDLSNQDASKLAALRAFADDVYLHQVVERRADGTINRYLDLPDALAAAAESGAEGRREWRIHFHVPLFRERLGNFESTQRYTGELLALLRADPRCSHFEVETYTWDVLPDEFRQDDIVTAVARELDWTARQLHGG